MIFIVGGMASGKESYARSLGYPESEMAFDVHKLLRDARLWDEHDAQGDRDGSDGVSFDALVDELAGKSVVTCAEVGSGVVPLDFGERMWRDEVGRLSRELAERADRVVRMVCGIPVVLRDDGIGGQCAPAVSDGASGFPSMSASPTDRTEVVLGGADQRAIALELIIIRHGRTPGNERGQYVGALDQPLSDVGWRQARQAGVWAGVERVYVSSLRRARQTAQIMFPHAALVQVDGLEEMDFGSFAGRSADDMLDDPDYRAWVDGGCTGRCPQGESRDEFVARVCQAMEALLRSAAARGERRVIVVAHGGTMMASLWRFADECRDYYEWLVGNCAGYRIRVNLECSPPVFHVVGRAGIID